MRRIAWRVRGGGYRAIVVASGGRCGPGLRVERGLTLRHGAHSGISIGRNVYLGIGTVIDCPEGARVTIGNDVTLTHGVFISASQSVSVGDDSLIGEYVSIRDAEHGMDLDQGPIRNQPMRSKGCEIGRDVWIGRGCAILGGANLADGCVIGSNSIVKSDIPEAAIAVGSPAKVIRLRPRGVASGGQE